MPENGLRGLPIRSDAPCFQVHRNGSNQAGLTSGSETKIQFTFKEIDSHGWFDAVTNYRFKPQIPGKYLIVLTTQMLTTASGTFVIARIFKNGAKAAQGTAIQNNGTSGNVSIASRILDMNGSTDYVEGYVFHNKGSNADLDGTSTETFMYGVRVRG